MWVRSFALLVAALALSGCSSEVPAKTYAAMTEFPDAYGAGFAIGDNGPGHPDHTASRAAWCDQSLSAWSPLVPDEEQDDADDVSEMRTAFGEGCRQGWDSVTSRRGH